MEFSFVNDVVDAVPVSEEEISSLERLYGIRFPELLRSYYMTLNGCALKRMHLFIEDYEYSVRCILPIIHGGLTMEKLKKRIRGSEVISESLFPVADDYSGGMILWDSLSGKISYVTGNDGTEPEYIFASIDEMFEAMNEAVHNGEYRRNKRMSKIDYKPLGSVVVLNGGSQRILIIARGLNVENDGETYFFDYGGVPYPDGLTGDRMAYFNHDAIARVFFEGYRDDENEIMNERLNEYIEQHPELKRKSFTE